MIPLQSLATEFAVTVSNGAVWLSIGQGLLVGAICLIVGILAARAVGLLPSNAPAGETIAVGLSSGLIVLAAWWAAIWSGGRSSFTPVAVGFAIAIAIPISQRIRRQAVAVASDDVRAPGDGGQGRSRRRSLILSTVAGGLFVVAIALLYGSTIAPSPRDGFQPIENRDVAFYAVLGRDLAMTGTETNLSPSGFSQIPGAPVQTWYHWGEMWVASATITILGAAPVAARFFIVLPLVLLAAAALTGTIVRRMAGTNSRMAFLFGFLACLFLAPVPVIPGPFFSSWAVGMVFGATLYGLGAVAGLLAIYCLVVLPRRQALWSLAAFVGSAVVFILPAHLALAVLALVGTGIVVTAHFIRAARAHKLTASSPVWVRTAAATVIVLVATVAWGIATGHGIPSSLPSTAPPPNVPAGSILSPFNASWRESVGITILGAGLFLAIPIAWFLRRKEEPHHADLYLATLGLLAAGAIGWGARLGDFTMFYLYFAGIAVFATAIAAAAGRTVWERLRARQHRWLALGLVMVCLIQLEVGVASTLVRLQGFGPSEEEPISLGLLDAIRALPVDAKLAYSCVPFQEVAFGTPQMLSIDAHTGRRVVPMCFEAEIPNLLLGAERSLLVPSQFFRGAPQGLLYPDAAADPSSAAVATFLKEHGINYIFADARHPNPPVDDAVEIAAGGNGKIFRIP